MVVFNYSGREINAKIVYYGPGLSGKTTNLEYIYSRTPSHLRGKMVSMKTKVDRTLFFDFLPIEGGEIAGFNVRFLLYTVPGQVYYNATRKLVLKGADAIVFVADSQAEELAANRESLNNLRDNLREHGKDLSEIPLVIQYNKRDLPSALPIEKLEQELNSMGAPSFEAIATKGIGVFETLAAATKIVIRELRKQLHDEEGLENGREISFGVSLESSGTQLAAEHAETDSSTFQDKVPDVPSPGEEPSPCSATEDSRPTDIDSDMSHSTPLEATDATALDRRDLPMDQPVGSGDSLKQESPDSNNSQILISTQGLARDGKLRIPIRLSGGAKPGHVVLNVAVDLEIIVDDDNDTV